MDPLNFGELGSLGWVLPTPREQRMAAGEELQRMRDFPWPGAINQCWYCSTGKSCTHHQTEGGYPLTPPDELPLMLEGLDLGGIVMVLRDFPQPGYPVELELFARGQRTYALPLRLEHVRRIHQVLGRVLSDPIVLALEAVRQERRQEKQSPNDD